MFEFNLSINLLIFEFRGAGSVGSWVLVMACFSHWARGLRTWRYIWLSDIVAKSPYRAFKGSNAYFGKLGGKDHLGDGISE